MLALIQLATLTLSVPRPPHAGPPDTAPSVIVNTTKAGLSWARTLESCQPIVVFSQLIVHTEHWINGSTLIISCVIELHGERDSLREADIRSSGR